MTGAGGAALDDPVVARRAVLDRRRALLDAARLFSCAVALGVAVAGLASILLVPVMLARPGLVTLPVLAAAFGGAGGAVAQVLSRARRTGGEGAQRAVFVGSAFGALAGLVVVWLVAWAWRVPTVSPIVGALLVLCWVGGTVAVVLAAHAWSAWRARRTLPEPSRSLAVFTAAVVVACAAFGLLAATAAPDRPPAEFEPGAPLPMPAPAPAPGHGDAGYPGEEPGPPVEVPPLEEARRQFAALAEATTAAAGPRATWADPLGPVIAEAPCGGGILLTLDGEFTMGVITDTTTDEHDREVTEDNVAAAQRIGAAWQALGMTAPEPLHGEQHFGGGSLGAVEHAVVGFAFGVAQPQITGRCVPLAG